MSLWLAHANTSSVAVRFNLSRSATLLLRTAQSTYLSRTVKHVLLTEPELCCTEVPLTERMLFWQPSHFERSKRNPNQCLGLCTPTDGVRKFCIFLFWFQTGVHLIIFWEWFCDSLIFKCLVFQAST